MPPFFLRIRVGYTKTPKKRYFQANTWYETHGPCGSVQFVFYVFYVTT